MSEWVYIAPTRVFDDSPRFSLPEEVLEMNILEADEPIHWEYEKASKMIVVSNKRLETSKGPAEDRQHEYIGETIVPKDIDLVRIPHPLQEDAYPLQYGPITKPGVPEEVRLQLGERYHFAYRNDGMADGPIRSCYFLSNEELSDRLSDLNI